MSTYLPKVGEIAQNWHVIDATDQVLGRLASKIAIILQGKHKPAYTPFVDTGDFVVVINADKVRLTGRKSETQEYQTYSRYPSGLHIYTYREMNANHPEKVLEVTVRRMLPKNKLARHMLDKLKIYRGTEHPHQAQQPKEMKLAF